MNWLIRFIVTKNSENDRNEFGVPHNIQVRFTCGAFTFIKMMNGRVFESSDKSALDIVAQTAAGGFKSLAVDGNRVNFYNVPAATVTQETEVAAYLDFPEEIFLDQAGTEVVDNFAWTAATYPGSNNP